MGNIQRAETEKYGKCWALEDYHKFSPGENYAGKFFEICDPNVGSTVCDFGCGAGKGGLALRAKGLAVSFFDLENYGELAPFISGSLWKPINRHPAFDYGFCCDVMEHLPTQFTMLAVQNMLNVCSQGVFFSICFNKDHFGKVVGDELHLTVKPFQWWRDCLREMGEVLEARDLIGEGLFYVRS